MIRHRLCHLPTRMLTIILHYHHRTGGNSCAHSALNAAVSRGLDFCRNRTNPINMMKGNDRRPSSANFLAPTVKVMLTDSIVTSDTPCQDFKPLYKTHESVLGTHGTGLDRENVLARN